MRLGNTDSLIVLILLIIATQISRVLPFLIFRKRTGGEWISFLSKTIPYASMALLLVYCLREVSLLTYPHGLPEGLALLSIFILHKWKKSTLISIAGGSAVYMVLVQMVFV